MSAEVKEQVNEHGVILMKEPPPGNLGLVELYALSIGQVIGAGIITLVGPAIALTGYSAWLGYFLAIILGFFSIFPITVVTGAIRMSGGYYSLLAATTNKALTGMFAVSQLTGMFSLSLFGISLGLYINSVFPAVNKTVCGIVLLVFFWFINIMGLDLMASAQKLMTWILIACLLMFIVAGFMKMQNPIFDFTGPLFMTDGFKGLMMSMFLYVYSCSGYSMTMNYGAAAKNATRDIPKAILLSVPTITVLYVGVAMAGVGVLPLDQVMNQPLTIVAKETLPGILFAVFIIGGPVMALTTTMNSSMPAMALPMKRSCDDGWFPKAYGKENKRGASVWILTTHLLIGLLPMVLNFSITTITNNILLLGTMKNFLQIYACQRVPARFPEAWKHNYFKMGRGMFNVVCFIGYATQIAIFIYSANTLTPTIVIVSIVATAICMVFGFVRARSPNVKIYASVWGNQAAEDEKAESATA